MKIWTVTTADGDEEVLAVAATFEAGCLVFYDAGIKRAFAPGAWQHVEFIGEQ